MYQKRYAHRIYAPGPLVIDLVNSLVDRGNEVFFFTAEDVPTKATIIPGETELLEKAYHLEPQQDLSADMNEVVSLYEAKKYYELGLTQKAFLFAKDKGLDIIHNFHAFSNFSHYFESESQTPTLYTLHWPAPAQNTFEYWRYKKFADRNFVAISEFQKKLYQEQIPGLAIPGVVYNGIQKDIFPFENEADAYFAFIGRLAPEKGLDIAIDVVGKTGDTLKIATQITPVIEKSDYYITKILPHLSDHHISMAGYVEGENRSAFLGKAKALMLPLQWDEPFGLVMTQSMACGTPVIAYNRGSVSEIIKDGVTGFIIDPDDEERPGKGSWIVKQKGIDGLREAMSRIHEIDRKACREHAVTNFSVEKMAEGYENIYKNLSSHAV